MTVSRARGQLNATSPRRGRDRHLHVHQHQARHDHRREADQPRRGHRHLHLHRRRLPASISDSGEIVVANLVPGTYTSTEADPSEGWDLGAILCDDSDPSGTPSTVELATRTATFELDPGETVTCVFINVQRGTITIIKDAQPDDAQDFHYDFTGLDGPVAFNLDDDGRRDPADTWSLRRTSSPGLLGRRGPRSPVGISPISTALSRAARRLRSTAQRRT